MLRETLPERFQSSNNHQVKFYKIAYHMKYTMKYMHLSKNYYKNLWNVECKLYPSIKIVQNEVEKEAQS